MRLLAFSLVLLVSACGAPTLELDLARATDQRAEVVVLARDGAGLAGRGTVALALHRLASTSSTTLTLDEGGSARLLACAGECGDAVQVSATWQGVHASLEARLDRATVSRYSSGGPTPPPPGFDTATPDPRVIPRASAPVPSGSRYFGGGDVALTLEVVDQNGSPSPADVTLESHGRALELRALADGLVTFFDVPAGPATVAIATTSAGRCLENQPCVSAWVSTPTSIVVGPAKSERRTVRSGW